MTGRLAAPTQGAVSPLEGVRTRNPSSTCTLYRSCSWREDACQTLFRWSRGCFTSVLFFHYFFQVSGVAGDDSEVTSPFKKITGED